MYRLEQCNFPSQPAFLPQDVYEQALGAFVRVCTDIVLVIPEEKKILLAKRGIPFCGWWIFGGRAFPGESFQASAKRCLLRETGLDIREARFQFLCANRYQYVGLNGESQDDFTLVFVVKGDAREFDATNITLDSQEYDESAGVQLFDLERLLIPAYQIPEPIRNLYSKIFP